MWLRSSSVFQNEDPLSSHPWEISFRVSSQAAFSRSSSCRCCKDFNVALLSPIAKRFNVSTLKLGRLVPAGKTVDFGIQPESGKPLAMLSLVGVS